MIRIKQITISTFILFLLVIIVSCGDKYIIEGLGDVPSGARIKFVQACSNCPSMHVKVGGNIVTGTSLAYNATFPSVGYAVFPAGEVNYQFVRSDSGTLVLGGKITANDGKYYTVYLNDTLPTQTAFVIDDDDVNAVKEDTMARIKFVHVLTGKLKDTLEIVRKIDSKVLFTGVTFGKSTAFTVNQGNIPDSFFIRKAGTTTAYPGLGSSISTWAKGRTYTIYARGVTGKTGTPAPGLTFYTNR